MKGAPAQPVQEKESGEPGDRWWHRVAHADGRAARTEHRKKKRKDVTHGARSRKTVVAARMRTLKGTVPRVKKGGQTITEQRGEQVVDH